MNNGRFDKLKEKIAEITFSDATKSNIKRENANIDGNCAMGTMLQYGSAVSNAFCEDEMLTEQEADAHDSGDVHYHDKDFYNMGTLTCCQIDLSKLFKGGFSTGHGTLREPNGIESYGALTAIAIQADQNDQHGGQSVPALDYYLAPGVKKSFKSQFREYFELMMDTPWSNTGDMYDIRMENPVLEAAFPKVYEATMIKINKRTYQTMEGLVHNLNTMHSRAGAQVPFSSLNFGTDRSPEGRLISKNLLLAIEAGLGHGETPIFPIAIFKVKEGVNYNPQDPNYDLFKLSIRVSAKRLFPGFAFLDAPFNLQHYDPNDFNTEVCYMGCRTRVVSNVYDESRQIPVGRGNLSFSTINLPRLGIKHGVTATGVTSYDSFFNELEAKMEFVSLQLLKRMQYQGSKKVKNFPFLMGQGVWMDSEKLNPEDTLEEVLKHGSLSIGFIGLAECLKALIGEHHGESIRAQELGLKIIETMRAKTDALADKYKLNFTLLATPAEGISGRFVKLDAEKYGIIEGVTDREFYTNSFHVPVYHQISAFGKIDIEAPYHALTNAGHISYIEIDGNARQNLEAFEAIIRHMKESGIGYGNINHPVDRCPKCGYNGIIGDECPQCHTTEKETYFERIRRITGYLVGGMDRWNDAKLAEEKARVKHTMSSLLTKQKEME